MFKKLFKYISGDNNQNRKVQMTAPVLTVYKNVDNNLINKNSNVLASMRFYVPKDAQENTPVPNDSNQFIQTEPEMIVATYRFGGWASK